MISPIVALKLDVSDTAFAVAPEKENILRLLCQQHGVKFEYKENGGVQDICCLDKEIRLPILGLEYLWACSYYFTRVHVEYVNAQECGAKRLQISNLSRLQPAIRLKKWGLNHFTERKPWPSDLPRPYPHFVKQNLATKLATELFLVATGWIVLHEICHAKEQHCPTDTVISISDEREADKFATDWMLCDLDISDERFEKRALGIATALLCLETLRDANLYHQAHPLTVERIFSCLHQDEDSYTPIVLAYTLIGLQAIHFIDGLQLQTNEENLSKLLSETLVQITRIVQDQRSK